MLHASENEVPVARETRLAGAKHGQSLLQQGSKRRAPFGDVTNRVGAGAGDLDSQLAKDAKTRGSLGGADEVVVPAEASTRANKAPAPLPLPDIDSADASNIFLASDYVVDIFSYFRRVEPRFRVAADYMKKQVDINEKMRAILVDWLSEVHLKFKLAPETMFLSVNLIDRFLEKKQVTRRNLQLVGVTAMLIASKYEEIWAPEVRDFVYISDKAYTREQILECEHTMLNVLGFNLTLPTYYNFLSRYLKAAGKHMDKQVACLSSYLAELALVDAPMLKYSYSVTAAAAVFVASLAVAPKKRSSELYPMPLERHSGYSLLKVGQCAAALIDLMAKAPANKLAAVFKKYSSPKLLEVSKTPVPALNPEWAGDADDMVIGCTDK
ncbi:hypothetical protein FOA52_008537 [Chlamydomonas sp. UWO 241]|nr:hypothetical protein FOA52_008537 [Chlamydomonas sp. UWO 241]